MKAKVVEIDLGRRSVKETEIASRPWLGGRGLAVKLFTDRMEPAADPFSPESVVVIATSPLTGTTAPTAGRGHLVFKSPLTGTIGSANSGGRFGKVMKAAGVDALILRGAAETPVYVYLTDQGSGPAERVRIEEAGELWGRSVPEVSDELSARHGRSASVLAVGPAGERLVRFASLMNEKNRAYGRGGPGAVFGAKKLKAVVVNGSRRTEIADPRRFQDAAEQLRHVLKQQPVTKRVLRDLGTAGLVLLINQMGMLPHNNFRDCSHLPQRLRQVSGEAIAQKILARPGGCYACPILCQRHTRIGEKTGEGPEFETVILMGPDCDIYDLERITLGNYTANELGLDTISLGGTLACALELVDRSIIKKAELTGLTFRAGNPEIYPEIVTRLGLREGLGDLLAEGSLRLAEKFERPELAMQVKGLELPAYDPRGMMAQALGFMTSPTGACHLRGGYSVQLAFFGGMKEVPRFSVRQAALTAKNQQDLGIIQDSLGVCRFTGFAVGPEHWARLYGAVIGEEVSRGELAIAAERIACLERLFNISAGFGRQHDDLPPRFKQETITIDGEPRRISDEDRNRMLDDYYRVRGWDRDGLPAPATLEELGIEE